MHVHFILIIDVLSLGVVRSGGCGKFEGQLGLSINTKGSFSGSLRDAPSLNHVFIAFICLATASQLFLSRDDRYECPARF